MLLATSVMWLSIEPDLSTIKTMSVVPLTSWRFTTSSSLTTSTTVELLTVLVVVATYSSVSSVDVAVSLDLTGSDLPTGVFLSASVVVLTVAIADAVAIPSVPSVLSFAVTVGSVALTSTPTTSPTFAFSTGITGVLALALISSVALAIGV